MSAKEFPWGKVGPARKADNSTVLVVLNVKTGMEAQHYIPPLSLHDLLRESFTFTSQKKKKKTRNAPLSQKSVLQCSSWN